MKALIQMKAWFVQNYVWYHLLWLVIFGGLVVLMTFIVLTQAPVQDRVHYTIGLVIFSASCGGLYTFLMIRTTEAAEDELEEYRAAVAGLRDLVDKLENTDVKEEPNTFPGLDSDK